VYGLPQVVLSDFGANFLSDTFMGICKLLGIKKIKTTLFRPESNGSNERSHRSLSTSEAM
jgi:transposase InsO family protein